MGAGAAVLSYGLLIAARIVAAPPTVVAPSGPPVSGAAAVPPAATVCLPAAPVVGLGVVDPFHVPPPAATQLNADGKVLYRQGRWDEARAKYRAAEAADPDFLAPALNVACSFVRQERFGEAIAEVLRLLDRAFLPWSEEVLSAADLGALKVRPEGKQLRTVLSEGRFRWAEGLQGDVILVARTRAPLKLGTPGTAEAALVLGPRQEIFAWSPRTRRYRQLTSEEGRVLAVARSSDGRRISYATAEKLIRGPGSGVALRGVVLKELELGTLSALGRGILQGDVRSLQVLTVGTGFAYRIERATGFVTYRFKDGGLEPSAVPRKLSAAVSLTGHGVAKGVAAIPLPGGCEGTARDVRDANAVATVWVRGKGRGPEITIGGPFGAGLTGLPIP